MIKYIALAAALLLGALNTAQAEPLEWYPDDCVWEATEPGYLQIIPTYGGCFTADFASAGQTFQQAMVDACNEFGWTAHWAMREPQEYDASQGSVQCTGTPYFCTNCEW